MQCLADMKSVWPVFACTGFNFARFLLHFCSYLGNREGFYQILISVCKNGFDSKILKFGWTCLSLSADAFIFISTVFLCLTRACSWALEKKWFWVDLIIPLFREDKQAFQTYRELGSYEIPLNNLQLKQSFSRPKSLVRLMIVVLVSCL